MSTVPVQVIIRITRRYEAPRKPRTFKWVGHERKLAALWENGLFI